MTSNTLWYGDNLNILRGFETASVDLIYLDPPYNSKRDYNNTFGSVAQSKAFTDTWTWGKDDDQNLASLDKSHPAVHSLLQSLGMLLPKRGLYPYLVNMAVRLVEMRRVLKDTGSIYLHVDPTASHYLKLVMDQIFGGGNFRNEIVWSYRKWTNSPRFFQKNHDIVLFYSKTDDYQFNPQMTVDLTDSRRAKLEKGYDSNVVEGGVKQLIVFDEEKAAKAIASGKYDRIVYRQEKGVPMADWWEIPILNSQAAERTGYKTQKPLALVERIIKASSNEGDVVLDPYMGSGTTIEAAAAHGRKWIGIDMTHHSIGIATKRLSECGLNLRPEQVIGVPADLASARKLKEDSPRQFDAWCALQCGAFLQDEDKKGEDKGRIVGIKPFASIKDGKQHTRRVLYAATQGDPPAMADIKETKALMKKHGCEVGKLFCFEMPEDPQVLLAIANTPTYADDMREVPGLDLITVRELLAGCSAPMLTSEYRERRMRDLSRQLEIV